jgi:hypothetical protein
LYKAIFRALRDSSCLRDEPVLSAYWFRSTHTLFTWV